MRHPGFTVVKLATSEAVILHKKKSEITLESSVKNVYTEEGKGVKEMPDFCG